MPDSNSTTQDSTNADLQEHNSTKDNNDSASSMGPVKIDPQRASTLLYNIAAIRNRISVAASSSTSSTSSSSSSPPTSASSSNNNNNNNSNNNNTPPLPRLVAVSKLKPASDILALHTRPSPETVSLYRSLWSSSSSSSSEPTPPPPPQLHFGENYVQELIQKSKLLPTSVRWHFIGGLQSNKCAQLAREVPNLWAVESVDSVKKAKLLNKGRGECRRHNNHNNSNNNDNANNGAVSANADADADTDTDTDTRLRVFVQINTSGEESKSGVPPKSQELLDLCRMIRSGGVEEGSEQEEGNEEKGCAHLKLQGLMTIGAIARSQATTPENENEDFIVLRDNRDWVVKELGLEGKEAEELQLELSMGMSEDFEGAIRQGSGEVRVGSTIFGERPPKSEAKVV